MSNATVKLHDVTSLTTIALLFAFESLKQMSETASHQGRLAAVPREVAGGGGGSAS